MYKLAQKNDFKYADSSLYASDNVWLTILYLQRAPEQPIHLWFISYSLNTTRLKDEIVKNEQYNEWWMMNNE